MILWGAGRTTFRETLWMLGNGLLALVVSVIVVGVMLALVV